MVKLWVDRYVNIMRFVYCNGEGKKISGMGFPNLNHWRSPFPF